MSKAHTILEMYIIFIEGQRLGTEIRDRDSSFVRGTESYVHLTSSLKAKL